MENDTLWKAFEKTGTIDDYLRYRQAVNAVTPAQAKEGERGDPQNRRTDSAGT
ncbi:MAG: hypothetical protein MJ083_03865 [Clostridia bacterium]|nr:hypothetical protein [Clostridia bacterium]